MVRLRDVLTAPAGPHELSGLAEPIALFGATIAPTGTTTPTISPPSRRIPVLSSLISVRTGAAAAGIAIGLGGTAVVAYSATRPPTAPPAVIPVSGSTSSSATQDTPGTGEKEADRVVGPDANGPAGFGLCHAWANHHKHDDGAEGAEGSVAMRNLVAAAGGEDKVDDFCAAITRPGTGAKDKKPGEAGRSGKTKAKTHTQGPKSTPDD